MKTQELINWLERHEWQRKGNSKNFYNVKFPKSRYVLQKLVLRYETCSLIDGEKHWTMIRHRYISKLSLSSDDKLQNFKPWYL